MSTSASTPGKRKSPVKKDPSKLSSALTDGELKALCYGLACTTEKIKVDYEKLGLQLNITRKSACNQFTTARNKLEKFMKVDAGADQDDPDDEPFSPSKKLKQGKLPDKAKSPQAPKAPRKAAKSPKAENEVAAEDDLGDLFPFEGLPADEDLVFGV